MRRKLREPSCERKRWNDPRMWSHLSHTHLRWECKLAFWAFLQRCGIGRRTRVGEQRGRHKIFVPSTA
jgi:hypothetical protein